MIEQRPDKSRSHTAVENPSPVSKSTQPISISSSPHHTLAQPLSNKQIPPNMALQLLHTAQDVITTLNLTAHPEKGYFIETFRDPYTTPPSNRAPSTYIYYLLEGDAGFSYWHRVLDAVEVWHYYAGAPLQLSLSWDDGNPTRNVILGPDIWSAQRPQVVIDRGEWQHALSLGEWTLVGCSVAPAYEDEGFEMAEPGWEPRVFVDVEIETGSDV
ncbi:RmlC-like cupin domain-containing protein [Aspergillus karnatakaensis]|uniref:cupin domain-containing protein n=1 Tax=Aspergillus karnatakaensis TaxID=1810916 RepID=UPI003CCD6884